ncbi:MAG: ATP-binding protein [Oscillospiraceae bacterium]|nr:ATP-binding protein [Oscillospiraceae bacterium]
MSIKNHEFWQMLESKANDEDPITTLVFVEAVWQVCQYGIDLSKTIRDTFQTYTLHDEIHICNVMTIMLQLIGNLKNNLTRDECALLIMAACCHDIGMSVTDEEKTYLRNCPDCMQTYLEEHPNDYSIAYEHGLHEKANITNEILQHYIRANHHRRVYEQLQNAIWPEILGRSMSINDLISVCQNHGEDVTTINKIQQISPNLDLCFCAVILRLGDILDFDATRAPNAIYRYINLAHLDGMENEKSRLEWQKHHASRGFKFMNDNQHTLIYRAECTSIQVEQAIVAYLNWVDTELNVCGKMIRYMEPRWRKLMFPGRIQRQITARGYISGEYKLTIDQERVLELLVGRELYSDPAVFVRELIQNAIDAVRTRKQMDKNLPYKWTPQINIRTWVDYEGFYWFRIEDNGIGMTEQMIKKYFLKVGHSYYNSDQFRADKIRCGADIGYKPISRFGIGILSCFMGDYKNNRVEVTTKHFAENGTRYPAYRLSIHGINGYYYIANDNEHRTIALEMPNNPLNGQSFISNPGTIIAVRTNLYQSGGAHSFKDIIDKYVVYPDVPIHYDGVEGVYNYKTEQEFIDTIQTLTPCSKDDIYHPIERIPIPENFYSQLLDKYPEFIWEEKPNIAIYCLPLSYFTRDPLIKGVTVLARAEGSGHWHAPGLNKKYVPKVELYLLDIYSKGIDFGVYFYTPSNSNDDLKEHVLPAINAQLKQLGICSELDDNSYEFRSILSSTSFHDYEGVSIDEIRAYQSTALSSSCYLSSDIFEQFSWYRALFSQYFKSEKDHNIQKIYINAHNGIFIDSSPILASANHIILNTIIMLKDEYYPTINLSRNSINALPLEASYSLELLADSIYHNLRISRPNYQKHTLIPLKSYWDILTSTQFSPLALHFMTNLGSLTLSEIELALEKNEKLILKEPIESTFHIAALLQQFDLKVDFTQKNKGIVYIVKECDAAIKEKLLSFPPALFIPTFSNDNIIMGICEIDEYYMYIDQPYNAYHPFSKWLIQNGDTLQNFAPGVYSQIINQLQSRENVIENVNTSISLLRKMPNLRMEIPQNLTVEDFIAIKR